MQARTDGIVHAWRVQATTRRCPRESGNVLRVPHGAERSYAGPPTVIPAPGQVRVVLISQPP